MQKCLSLVIISALLIGFYKTAAAAQTVDLPITIDYTLLQNMIVEQAFANDGSTTLVNEGNGCIFLALSDPRIEEQDQTLRVETNIDLRVGTPLPGGCIAPLEWQGILALRQLPSISPDTWKLNFSTTAAELLGNDRQPVQIANLLWSLVEKQALSYMDDIVLNLAPPVNQLKEFLLPLFPGDIKTQAETMLATLRPANLRVDREALRFDIQADVESVYTHNKSSPPIPLEGEALKRMISLWENWDGLLVYLVTTLSRQLLSEQEQQTLINVLLDARYQFVTELNDRTMTRDFVRDQFVSSWQQLAPIFRKHLFRETENSRALGYLAFVSSADALLVFDRLGPTFGLEISRNGLIRLGTMLEASPDQLLYKPGTNPDLQKLFRLKTDESDNGKRAAPRSEPENPGSSSYEVSPFSGLTFLGLFGPREACAAQPTFQEILQWKIPDANLSDYISKVESLLDTTSQTVWQSSQLPEKLEKMFQFLIQAMAWQESCFRQFVVKDGKLTYLLSYNQSSVGLMQVNERIWRGMFRRDRLRWDIGYNADAGCQIAALYLQKYALRDQERVEKLDNQTLARLVYAMYNGGPSQYAKFFQRLKTNKLFQSDELFWEKYRWAASGEVAKVSLCLVGS